MTTLLTAHFEDSEFGISVSNASNGLINIFRSLCTELLEPIRAFVKLPIRITSGYRTPQDNAIIHGVPNSEHVATDRYCAADFTFNTTFGLMMSYRRVFDWIRNNPTLPFHQVILEHGADGTSIIHISYNLDVQLTIRSALEGATHNTTPYIAWECAAYDPPLNTGQENA